MRKYIIGTLIGFCLSFAVGANAEVVSMDGKVVEGTVDVTVNGDKLDVSGIIVDGTSYLPVRAMGDALGMDVGYTDTQGVTLNQIQTTKQEQIAVLGTHVKELTAERSVLSDTSINPYEVPAGKLNGRDIFKPKDEIYYAAKKRYEEIGKELNELSLQINVLANQ